MVPWLTTDAGQRDAWTVLLHLDWNARRCALATSRMLAERASKTKRIDQLGLGGGCRSVRLIATWDYLRTKRKDKFAPHDLESAKDCTCAALREGQG